MNTKAVRAMGWVLCAFSLLLLIGVFTFLQPCGPREDGTWMHCHQAGEAVKLLAGVLALLSLGAAVAPKRMLARVCAALIVPAAVVTALLPGTIIPMCVPGMRCQTTLRPGALVLSVLLGAGAAVAFALTFARERRGRR